MNLESENSINSNSTNLTGNTGGGEKRYNKFVEAVKQQGKKQNKILKALTTASLTDILQVNKWWKEEESNALELSGDNNKKENDNEENNKNKWQSMQHNGLLFAPKYEPHGIKIKYNVIYLKI